MNFEVDSKLLSCFSTKPLPSTVDDNTLNSRAGEAFFKLVKNIADIKRHENENHDLTKEDFRMIDYTKSPFEVTLDDAKTILPRFRKFVREEKILTKWEKFAKEKGIQKKKRSRKVFDEVTQDWVPRWGAKSIKKMEAKRNFVIEEKEGETEGDPFAKAQMTKNLQRAKQVYNEQNNSMQKQKSSEKFTSKLSEKKKEVKKVLDVGILL